MTAPTSRAISQGDTVPAEDAANLIKPDKPRRYRNEPCEMDGLKFDSRKEMRRYQTLSLLLAAGEITDLYIHPRFDLLSVRGTVIGHFTPDFEYHDANNRVVIEDVKSPATRKETAYRLRKKLFESQYGIEITEV